MSGTILDNHIIIKAKAHNGINGLGDIYLVYKTEQVVLKGEKYLVCEPVWNPQRLVGKSTWVTHAEEGPKQGVWHHRYATNACEASNYYGEMQKTNKSIMLERIGETYVWNMESANLILPSTYYHVCHGLDVEKLWHFSAACKSNITVPRHVVCGFMEHAIGKGEVCPITMDTLTKETIAYTACGHLFDRQAVSMAIRESGKCPTCRAKLSLEDICGY